MNKLVELQARFKNVAIEDKGMKWNTDLTEAWELGCLIDLAQTVAAAAHDRKESRGGHYREDYPDRDDVNFLKHSMVSSDNGKLRIAHKPVVITKYQPTERKY
jgi:succinate dehydrogenase / fumarate reductase flavoprotein subunit